MQQESQRQALEPHQYPLLIQIFGLSVIAFFVYSLYLFPQYLSAAKNLKLGENLLDQKKYSEAIVSFKKVIAEVPSSKEAKILLAISHFSNDNVEDDIDGIDYLQGIELYETDWQRVSKVMPIEYQIYFQTVNK